MIDYWDYFTFGYDAPHGGQGTASTLPPPPEERDMVAELRAVIEEVTGKPVEQPAERRIGFV